MSDIDILRAELERLFELEELIRLSQEVLGFDPDSVGGTAAKGSFAGALTTHCAEHEAIEALCDAVIAWKAEVNPKIQQLRVNGLPFDEELRPGETAGPYTIVRKLGEGRLGISYLGKYEGRDFRVKVLRREATRDRRGLHRFLTVTRLVGAIEHPGLPAELRAGSVDDRVFVAHQYIEGQTLAARISRTGPMHVNEARPLLKAILEPLKAIHARRLSHGDLRLENVIAHRRADGEQVVALLDAGSDRLRARARIANGHGELFSTVGSPRTVAPEQIRGLPADARSDIYSFGAMLYEILSGKPVFADKNAIEAAVGHLMQDPPPPSSVAPRGWVVKEVDEFVLGLLSKNPERRPRNAEALLDMLESIGRAPTAKKESKISDEELDKRIEALTADPTVENLATELEASVDEGADPKRVADAFGIAADSIEVGDDKDKAETKKSLLFRAARLFESQIKDLDTAEKIYVLISELDPSDEIAAAALEELRRRLGKYEELIEMLLQKREKSESRSERARALTEIGKLYAQELDDQEQAVIAFTQAFCEEPDQAGLAEEIERHAGARAEGWNEVLSTCSQAVTNTELPPDTKNVLLVRMGRWYMDKLHKSDKALPCYQAVVSADPANEAALDGMTQIYRKAQQWAELVMVLRRRADAATAPARARDLQAEAADVLSHQLNDTGGARDLYEQILTADPGHHKASEALGKIYEKSGDWAGLREDPGAQRWRRCAARRSSRRCAASPSSTRISCRRSPRRCAATRRCCRGPRITSTRYAASTGSSARPAATRSCSDNLRAQIGMAATPRQKIKLCERIAGHPRRGVPRSPARPPRALRSRCSQIDSAHEDGDRRADPPLPRARPLGGRGRALRAALEARDRERSARRAAARARARACPSRSARRSAPPRRTSACSRSIRTTAARSRRWRALREAAGDADAALSGDRGAGRQGEHARGQGRAMDARRQDARRPAATATARSSATSGRSTPTPRTRAATLALRAAYLARGDVNAAIQLTGPRRSTQTDGERAKAKLCGEMAHARTAIGCKDDKRAKEAARTRDRLSIRRTSTASTILGDLAFEAKRLHRGRASTTKSLADRADALDKQEAARILVRYVDALSQTGSTEKALVADGHPARASRPTTSRRSSASRR